MAISNVGSNARPGVCTSTTRPTAPFEGQLIYETDTNRVLIWEGAAWVMVADTDQPPGLQLITTGTLSGSSKDFLGCFTSEYDNYRIVVDAQLFGTPGFTVDLCFQFLDGTTPNTGSYYWAFRGIDNALNSYDSGSTGTVGRTGGMATTNAQTRIGVTMDFYGPAKVQPTTMTSVSFNLLTSTYGMRSGGCSLNLAQAHTGIRILSAGGQTIAGNATIYGYRK